MRKLLAKIRKILKDRRTRQLLTRTVSVTAAIVVFVTTYALVLPAITMEKVAECGVEEHQHDDSCYTEKLICEIPESPGHQHTDACYAVSTVLTCQVREHIHSVEDGCYDEDGNLICEIQEHTHSLDNGCYEEERELTCGLEESEGHTHDASCYQKILACGKEVHTHSTACYHIDAASTMATEAAAVASTEYAALANTTSITAGSEGSTAADGLEESTPAAFADDGLFGFADTASTIPGASPASTTSAAPAAPDEMTTSTDEGSYEFTADGASTVKNSDGATGFATDGTSTDTVSNNNKEADNSATASSTGSTAKAAAAGYVPVLDELNFNAILNNHTGIYYCHPASDDALSGGDETNETDGASGDIDETSDERDTGASSDTMIDSSVIPAEEWHRIPNNIEHDSEHDDLPELGEKDLLRVYLAYTIPAGSLNETNTVVKYRLPGNIRLTDDQVNDINKTVNGLASQYVDMSTLEITDADQYNRYLGIEAVEGTRTPDVDVQDYLTDLERSGKDAAEYISAVVRVENAYNELTGEYEGQDLIFTFAPYTVLKNQHEYDRNGQPTKAGEEVSGWVSLNVRTDQIEWEKVGNRNGDKAQVPSDKTADIVFVKEVKDKDNGIFTDEISTELRMAGKITEGDGQEAGNDTDRDTENDENTADALTTDGKTTDIADGQSTADREQITDKENKIDDWAVEDTESSAPVTIMPAMSFTDSIRVQTGKPAGVNKDGATNVSMADAAAANAAESLPEEAEISVRVEADEGTFPAGTTMVLKAVEDLDAVAEAVTETVEKTAAVSADDDSDLDSGTNGGAETKAAEEAKGRKPEK